MIDRTYLIILINSILISCTFAFVASDSSIVHHHGDEISRELIRNNGVTKIFSDYEITKDMVINGDLKIIGGELIVNGTVNGEIQVLGGDISINNTAVVNGTIIAIGGKIQKSPDAVITGEVLELNKDRFSISRVPDEDSGVDLNKLFKEDGNCHEDSAEGPKTPHSQPYSEDAWVRYNRAEGLYLQLNLHIDNEYLPGNTLYGGVGRSFHRSSYSGIIGFEQRLFNDSFQLYLEKYDRSATDDTWRINDNLNSLSAFMIHQDFLDWYQTDGFETGGFIVLPWEIKLSARYKNELLTSMNTVATWSLFGSQNVFRGTYLIEEGKEISLNYKISLGKLYHWKYTSSLTAFLQYSRTESQKKSDFIYTKQEITADTYFPITHDLGIHATLKAGTVAGDHFGIQHRYQIGGIGSLRGYAWKQFDGTQFSSGTIEVILGKIAIFYDRAAVWSGGSGELTVNHWNNLINSYSGESAGVSFGEHGFRLDIIKPLGETENNDIRVNFLIFFDNGGE